MKITTLIKLFTFLILPSVHAEDSIASLYSKSIENGDAPQEGKILLAQGHELLYQVEVSSKGNGTLKIGGLSIRTYDNHDDGVLYEGGALQHQFIDIDEDGDLDLIVSGIATITTDKGIFLRREAIVSIFLYDMTSRKLKESVKSKHIYSLKLS